MNGIRFCLHESIQGLLSNSDWFCLQTERERTSRFGPPNMVTLAVAVESVCFTKEILYIKDPWGLVPTCRPSRMLSLIEESDAGTK